MEISGSEEQLNIIAGFLAAVQWLGDAGASRTLSLWVDGDGGARLKTVFPDMENRPKIDPKSIGDNGKKFFLE